MVKTVAMTRWLIDRGGHFFKNTGPLNGGPTGFLLSNITEATGISPYYFLQGIVFFPLLVQCQYTVNLGWIMCTGLNER